MRPPNNTGENPGAGPSGAGQAGAGSGVTPPHEARVLIRWPEAEARSLLQFLNAPAVELYYTVVDYRKENEDAALVDVLYVRDIDGWIVSIRCTNEGMRDGLDDAVMRALSAEDYFEALERELKALCAAHGYSECEVWDLSEGEEVVHLMKFRR